MVLTTILDFFNENMAPTEENEKWLNIPGEITGTTRWFLHYYLFKILQNSNNSLLYNMVLGYGIRLFSAIFSRNFFNRYKLTNEVYYIMIGILLSIILNEITSQLFHNKNNKNNKNKKLNK